MPHSAEKQDVLEGFELSPEQARCWRWQVRHLSPESASAELVLRVAASVDRHGLRHSLLELCAEHEILRTEFRSVPGMELPLQVIRTAGAIAWNTGSDDPGALRVELRELASGEAWLRLTLPATHLDTTSLLQLAAAWARCYAGQRSERAPLQYADYAAWRHEVTRDASAARSSAREQWQRSSAARASVASLPLRGAVPLERIQPLCLPLAAPPQVIQAWLQAAERAQLSPAELALSAWVALLARHGGVDSLTVGVDWQERAPELTGALGLFSEPLPVTWNGLSEFDGATLGRATAERISELQAAREQYAGLRGEEPYGFGFRYVPALGEPETATLGGSGFMIESANSPTAPHQLLLEHRQTGAEPSLILYVDSGVYDPAAAQILGDQLLSALDAICRSPAERISELSLLSRAEQSHVLGTLSHAAPLSPDREALYGSIASQPSLAACFSHVAFRQPDLPAVEGQGPSLSYAELEQRSSVLAAELVARGAGSGARVAHFLPRETSAVVAMLGILRAGAAYVPIDPDYPQARIDFILADCGADLILTSPELVPRLPEALRDGARLLFVGQEHSNERPSFEPTPPGPDDTAYVIYTSGSTGQPRGVPITHRAALHSLAARLAYYPERIERFLLLSSFAFDSSLAGLFGTLAQGGCLRIASSAEQKDADRLAEIIQHEGVTQLLALPSLHQLLLARLASAPHRLRAAIVAGEACPAALVEAHHRALPSTRLYNEYGVTEAAVWSTVGQCVTVQDGRQVSIGSPIPHSSVYVLDAAGQPVARGIKGELYLGGPGLSQGYWNRPELSAEKFVTLRVSSEGQSERLYRTGDHGYWDDRGELVFLGRSDGQVKIRGYRIELGEIEEALRRATGIAEVVVLADRSEQGELFLRAFLESTGTWDTGELRRGLARLLPEPMVPTDIQALPALPRTANGKLDRQALSALERQRQRAPYVAPEGDTEQTLAALWSELLGIEKVGRQDDFFALGGHSLMAVRLVHRLQRATRRELPVPLVFQHTQLAALASAFDGLSAAGSTAPASGSVSSRPTLFCVDPTGLHASAYEPMADALASELNVIGLELGPALATEGPHVEAITLRLIEEVRRRQPHGPYHVLGWSSGGVLALSVARQLEHQGEQVAFLGVLDTQPPVRLYGAGEPDAIEELAAYVDPDRRSSLLSLPAATLQALRERLQQTPETERIEQAVTWAQNQGFLPATDSVAAIIERYQLLRDAALFVQRLPAGALRVPLHAWWTTQTLERHGGPPIDWQHYTQAAAFTETVTGDHFAVLKAPVVHERLRLAIASPRQELP
jgi:amino acid adenylation domain-containing protein